MSRKHRWLWALYDFANSLALSIVSFYFALWWISEKLQPDWHIAAVLGVSTALLLLTLPKLGRVADHKGLERFLFVTLSLFAIASLIGLGLSAHYFVHEPWLYMSLIFYFLFQYFFQASLNMYNSFLRSLSEQDQVHKLSGFGNGLGQLGNLVGLLLALPFVNGTVPISILQGREGALLAAGFFFLIAALPSFLWLKPPAKGLKALEAEPSWKLILKERTLLLFLVAYYLYVDSVLTLQVFLSTYLEKVFAFDDAEKTKILLSVLLFGMVGAWLSSFYFHLFGNYKKAISGLIFFWSLLILGFVFSPREGVIFLTVPTGICFGLLFSLSRAYWAKLIPAHRSAEYFTWYTTFERAASFLGPLLWSLVLLLPLEESNSYRWAVFSLGVLSLLGLLVFWHLPTKDPVKSA